VIVRANCIKNYTAAAESSWRSGILLLQQQPGYRFVRRAKNTMG